MTTERDKVFGLFIAVMDALLFVLAFRSAYGVRVLFQDRIYTNMSPIMPFDDYVWLLWVAIPVYGILLYRRGEYTGLLALTLGSTVKGLMRPFLKGTLVLGTSIFLVQAKNFSRPLFFLFVFFSLVGLAVGRALMWLALKNSLIRQRMVRYVLIVGTNPTALRLAAEIAASPGLARVRVGHLSEETPPPASVCVLGTVDDMPSVLTRTVIDDVFVALPSAHAEKVQDVIRACEQQGVTVHVHLQIAQGFAGRPQVDVFNGVPTLSLRSTPHDAIDIVIKRTLDIVGAAAALICLAPVIAFAAAAIRLTSGKPILYRQIRQGLKGRKFVLYKFRTMIHDADRRKPEILALNEMTGPVFKMAKDPRITPIGNVLRRYSIDELPQLWNVLVGDMSLVGPRPPLPDEVAQYEPRYRRRLSIKPGITCLWQISGRNNLDFDRWMELDTTYIRNWSLALDLKILLKTIPAVLLSRGAR